MKNTTKKKVSAKRRGEAKTLNEIFKEKDDELIINIEKGQHLDGGGKLDHYKKVAQEIIKLYNSTFGIVDKIISIARFLYNRENKRHIAMRKSMLKRTTLQKLRLKSGGKNVKFSDYEAAYKKAIKDTTKHSNKLKP